MPEVNYCSVMVPESIIRHNKTCRDLVAVLTLDKRLYLWSSLFLTMHVIINESYRAINISSCPNDMHEMILRATYCGS